MTPATLVPYTVKVNILATVAVPLRNETNRNRNEKEPAKGRSVSLRSKTEYFVCKRKCKLVK